MKTALAVLRWVALLVLLLVAAGLWYQTQWRNVTVLQLFWQGIVPLVPLLLLLAPHTWRWVCPLATLNLVGPRVSAGKREIAPPRLPRATAQRLRRYGIAAGAVALWIIVPLRLLLFNGSASATLVLVLSVGVVAVAMGFAMPWKSGWCASLCPIYPVEKFYGAAPVISPLQDGRCLREALAPKCYSCGSHCLDVPAEDGRYWRAMRDASAGLRRWRRFFIGSFPGFVLGYLLIWHYGGPLHLSLLVGAAVYGSFLALMLISYGVYFAAQTLFTRDSDAAMATSRHIDLAAVVLAINFYYLAGGVNLATIIHRLSGAPPVPVAWAIIAAVAITSVLWLRHAWRAKPRPGVAW